MKNQINQNLEIQGHRGCRGLMPENTIPGFIMAIDLGVQTLEMDVVVSKDTQIVVSHEAFFNHEITTEVGGIEVTETNEKEFNLFKMDYSDIAKVDVGSKEHPRFSLQKKMPAIKPLLKDVVDSVNIHLRSIGLNSVKYNIEIKHDDALDGIYNPTAEVFCKLVYEEIVRLGIKKHTCLQSFNPKCLNIIHQLDPSVTTALLVENKQSFRKNLEYLDFTPSIYSSYFELIDGHLMEYCHQHNIKVIPWTVNDQTDIEGMLKFGVDGIISDFPDKVLEIYESLKSTK